MRSRRCYKLSVRDLAEMFLIRSIVFRYEAIREWKAKFTPETLRRRPRGMSAKPTSRWC
jgi:transposase-like protein